MPEQPTEAVIESALLGARRRAGNIRASTRGSEQERERQALAVEQEALFWANANKSQQQQRRFAWLQTALLGVLIEAESVFGPATTQADKDAVSKIAACAKNIGKATERANGASV
jgi:hypothetical protein